MTLRKGSLFVGSALSLVLVSFQAQAHWCDDLWASSYNIVVRPESDTVTSGSNLKVFVQNNMGYLLPSFKLAASIGGTAITTTAPTTLKVPGTLLPGEKGTWVLPVTKSGGGTVKIEDITFSVSFGNSGESRCYPTKGANAVMVVKTDGTLYPSAPPPGLDSPVNPGCTGDLAQGRSLQYQAVADFEDEGVGLDALLKLYCAGRASFGSSDGVSQTYCKSSTSIDACPTSKPASGTGSKYDYMHLWAAGELAARKSALGARAAVLRARLQCGVNDADVGFAGYALFMLGYLGEDAGARTFIASQISGTGDMAAIAKASLLLMGSADDMTKYKADVQAGLKSSSTFVAAASAASLGIAAKDDTAVTGTLIPLVKWTEPDTSDDGKGMYASHLLALVAWDRRQWAFNGGDMGAVTFYGDVATGTGGNGGGVGGATGSGGTAGSGGASGNKDSGVGGDAKSATGGASGSGGVAGSGGAGGSGGRAGSGGAGGSGGSSSSGGSGGTSISGGAEGSSSSGGSGGASRSGGSSGTTSSGGSNGPGGASGGNTGSAGSSGSGGDTRGGSSTSIDGAAPGCKCNLGGHAPTPTMVFLAMAGLAWVIRRRRR